MQHRLLRDARHRLTVLMFFCAVSPVLALSPLPGAPPSEASLNRLALSVADGPDPLRADLAYAALAELAETYAVEAQRARQEHRNHPNDGDLRRWANAVDTMASELSTLAKTLTSTTVIDIGISPENSVYLIVDGKPVVVTGPRPKEQKVLEQRIMEHFCRMNWCDELLAGTNDDSLAVEPNKKPLWRFSQRAGPVCATHDGLEFQFRNTDHLREKRDACAKIVAELDLVTAAIGKRIESGTRIDWNNMTVRSYARGEPQRLLLNDGGEYLPLELPALAATPGLFRQVRPWLAARVTGGQIHIVVLNADGLMAPLGIPEY